MQTTALLEIQGEMGTGKQLIGRIGDCNTHSSNFTAPKRSRVVFMIVAFSAGATVCCRCVAGSASGCKLLHKVRKEALAGYNAHIKYALCIPEPFICQLLKLTIS